MKYINLIALMSSKMDCYDSLDVFKASEIIHALFPIKSLEQIVDDLIAYRS